MIMELRTSLTCFPVYRKGLLQVPPYFSFLLMIYGSVLSIVFPDLYADDTSVHSKDCNVNNIEYNVIYKILLNGANLIIRTFTTAKPPAWQLKLDKDLTCPANQTSRLVIYAFRMYLKINSLIFILMKTCREHHILTTFVRTFPLRHHFSTFILDMYHLRV